jgi:hypothetical protein
MSLRPFHRLSALVFSLSAAAILVSLTTPAEAQTLVSGPFANLGNQTLVPNGDFENGLTSWNVFNTSVTFTTTNVNPLFGANSVRGAINTTITGPGSAITQVITGLTPGNTYVLSAFINTENLTPQAKAYVDLNDVFGDPDVGPLGGSSTVFAYAPFVPINPSITIRFVVDAPNATVPAGSFATADNIAVTPLASFVPASPIASAAPEPGSLNAMAFGGLLVLPVVCGMIRRRRAS